MTQTVLVIDDSPEIHRLLDARLKPEVANIYHAMNASQGIVTAIQQRPDLILLDMEMPGISGLALCRTLKEDPRTAFIPIIFLTGNEDVNVKIRGFDLGAVDYITKPFNTAELRARVRAALRSKRYLDLLSARAQIDGLTGLYNRAYFEQRLAQELLATARYQRLVSLILIDLDHFKQINDSFGHPFGDLVLQRTSEVLLANVRATDVACRYGGEELVVILPETSMDGALTVAGRIRAQIAALLMIQQGQPRSVTASLGLSSTECFRATDRVTSAMLIEAADKALYEAKRGGRNRTHLAPAVTAEAC